MRCAKVHDPMIFDLYKEFHLCILYHTIKANLIPKLQNTKLTQLTTPTMFSEQCNWIMVQWLAGGDAHPQQDRWEGRPLCWRTMWYFPDEMKPWSAKSWTRNKIHWQIYFTLAHDSWTYLDTWGHISTSTLRIYPVTKGDISHVLQDIKRTLAPLHDGRISYQYSSTQEPQRHSHTTRITKCKFAMTLNACEERPLQILMSKCWNLKTSKFTDTQRQNKIRVPTFGGCGFRLIQWVSLYSGVYDEQE